MDVFGGLGVEILLHRPEDFLKIKETLTRIGIAKNLEKQLFQSCHILHKKTHYAIVHFKEMFILDGKETSFTESDRARRNIIVKLLSEWRLIKLLNPLGPNEPVADMNSVKILPYKDKELWTLISKYNVGKKKK